MAFFVSVELQISAGFESDMLICCIPRIVQQQASLITYFHLTLGNHEKCMAPIKSSSLTRLVKQLSKFQ